jgi:hypothetical protein
MPYRLNVSGHLDWRWLSHCGHGPAFKPNRQHDTCFEFWYLDTHKGQQLPDPQTRCPEFCLDG